MTRWMAGTLALLVVLGGCESESPTAAGPLAPTPTPVVLLAPVPGVPAEGAAITQNDPATGCPVSDAKGHGFQIPFEWTAGAGALGVAGYHLYVKHPNATIPIADVNVTVTRYLHRSCGGYVAPQNLNGWEWKVQARGTDGSLGPWSETRTFHFNPCMLTPRSYCGS